VHLLSQQRLSAGNFADCFSCHQSDFTGASNPSHTGFPHSCQDCHGVSAWQPASFDHNSTGFQLNGAHRSASCTSCHRSGYAGTPSDCFSCHQSEYTGTRNPNHASAGFYQLRGLTVRTAGHFILRPREPFRSLRVDTSCRAPCHVSPGNFNHFECILCHEHRQTETDNEHDDVGGYVYQSNACYQCHPRT
jgi:hypothetical protein